MSKKQVGYVIQSVFQVLIDFHDSSLIATSVAIVGRAEYRDDVEQTVHILFSPAFELQDVDEHAKQHVNRIIQRTERGNGAASRAAGARPSSATTGRRARKRARR